MTFHIQRLSFVMIDHSVLEKFLRADCIDLLSGYADRVMVTDHVRGQLTDMDQCSRFAVALSAGKIHQQIVAGPEELRVFGRLAATHRLGAGEQAAVAVACVRGCELAIDTNLALTKAIHEAGLRQQLPKIRGSKDILGALVRRGRLDEHTADRLQLSFVPAAKLIVPPTKRASGILT